MEISALNKSFSSQKSCLVDLAISNKIDLNI